MLKRLREKIFRKKETEVKSDEVDTGILRISDIVPMPSREEFLCDVEKQEKIDEYKKEYLKTLRLTRTITSVDIMPEELHNYQNIYLDLLMNLFETEDSSEVSFDSPNDIIDEELDLSIKCLKLRLYLEHVRELVIETKLRLIALNEILKEKKLSKTRENAVLNEINNLQHSLFIFQNQEWLMIKAIHNNLINIKNIDFKTFLENIDNQNIEEVNDEVIDKRLEEVREMALIVIPDIVGYLESLNLSPKVLIATLEQELEMYVYTHKDDLKVLSEETENLATTLVDLGLEELQKEQKAYIDTIHILELRYKIFSKYGRNLVSYDDLEELYENKFCILMANIFTDYDLNILESATHRELECYQYIVSEKINRIITGQETYINLLADKYKIDVSEIINIMASIFKSDDEFSFLKILNNRILLSLLLSLTYCEDWLNKFFTNTYVKISDYPEIDFYFNDIDWEDEVPLASICEMIDYDKKVLEKQKNNPFYKLYQLYQNTLSQDIYKLPEGIREMNYSDYMTMPQAFLNTIDKKCKDKTVIMPTTLRKINVNIFSSPISNVVLNEGLEYLGYHSLHYCSNYKLPTTIKYIDRTAINFKTAELRITNYKHIALLNNDDLLKKFISDFFRAQKTEKVRHHYISNETRRKQQIEATGRFSSSDHSYLFNHDTTFITFKIYPLFAFLVLEDENGKEVKLNYDDLIFETERSTDIIPVDKIRALYLLPEEIYTAMAYLRSQITKKFNDVEDLDVSKR